MKSFNFLYSSETELEKLIAEENLSSEANYLIRIHTGIHSMDNIMPFVKMIEQHFPNSKIIGSSSTGVIFRGDIYTEQCLVCITELEGSFAKTCLIDLSNSEGGDARGSVTADAVIDAVVSENSGMMLTFFARNYLKVDGFVNRFNEKAPHVQLIGGIANTPEGLKISIKMESFVFDNNSVSNNSVAAAVIDSEKMTVHSELIYVTEPVGVPHTITDADGLIIRAIDGVNAVEWYQEQLGIDLKEENDYDITVLFPLVRSDHSDMPWALSYSSQGEDDKIFPDEPEPVMFVPSEAKVGEKVRISYSSVQSCIEVCEKVCDDISEHPSEVLFGYSCISRQTLFKNCAVWELMPFKVTNLSGALVSGEIGCIDGVNYSTIHLPSPRLRKAEKE